MKITRVTEAERGQEGEDSEAASNYNASESSNFGISPFVHIVLRKVYAYFSRMVLGSVC